jgi:hypothetical protein
LDTEKKPLAFRFFSGLSRSSGNGSRKFPFISNITTSCRLARRNLTQKRFILLGKFEGTISAPLSVTNNPAECIFRQKVAYISAKLLEEGSRMFSDSKRSLRISPSNLLVSSFTSEHSSKWCRIDVIGASYGSRFVQVFFFS